MKLNSHIPIKIDIHEEEELSLGVKRLSYDEGVELRAKWKEAENIEEGPKRDAAWGVLLLDSFRRYIRIDCDLTIELADGAIKLRKGEELLEFFGARAGIVNDIFFSILTQNNLSAIQKKILLRHSGSSPSSDEQKKDPVGPKPETTATSAGNGASADSVAASSQAQPQSGSTEGETKTEDPQSSSTNARSVH